MKKVSSVIPSREDGEESRAARRFGTGFLASLGMTTLLFLLAVPLHAASRLPSRGKHAMVASVDAIASRVGVDIMKRGGNAVDAAVAVAFALAVTWPEAGNLGGGGFWISRDAKGRTLAVDFRETAPRGARRDLFIGSPGAPAASSTEGPLASGVP